ncbi:hypothetical protein FHS95_000330 [Sphingomonas naasensis]|uniref:Fe2OG dioxygenase domain-containing protein n=1 Tax=Sphingomonas naasensis TaxID=1344951 RepID=A0A4S1WRA5_9SPHN|nr:2OG-Fe(II) oxygenase [Sphingomonas naasensis]NIJ18661.1 hypothetical protein [Sphingomonas naasensis]TGX45901.1 hypothetical protein E5A74_01635 [Sphingomonas naasensis]
MTPTPREKSGGAALPAARYNAVLDHPTVRTALRYAARSRAEYDSGVLIERLAQLETFPAISVGALLSAARAAGLELRGFHAEHDELSSLMTPFLTYLEHPRADTAVHELVQVQELRPRSVVLNKDRLGSSSMSREVFEQRWSGLVLKCDAAPHPGTGLPAELASYRNCVTFVDALLTPAECAELIRYCENSGFRRSRVAQRRNGQVNDVVETRTRSSSSVVLEDRNHRLLARLYSRCATMEGVEETDIEHIQCVRYKRGQRFHAHFDGGVELPRLTTYLLYLNDDFAGGETYFPMLDLPIAPRTGCCLRFPSCDGEGRVLWPSEHGGIPVRSGVKYALNIWVRCPQPRFLSRMRAPEYLTGNDGYQAAAQ